MKQSLWETIRHWFRTRRTWDAVDPTAGGAALLRSPKIQAASADLPKIPRCSGKDGMCQSFVKADGALCHRCDPAQLLEERAAREARRKIAAPKVTAFRGKTR